jgi:hypothetical protein
MKLIVTLMLVVTLLPAICLAGTVCHLSKTELLSNHRYFCVDGENRHVWRVYYEANRFVIDSMQPTRKVSGERASGVASSRFTVL